MSKPSNKKPAPAAPAAAPVPAPKAPAPKTAQKGEPTAEERLAKQAEYIAKLEATVVAQQKRIDSTQALLSRYVNAQLAMVEENNTLKAQLADRLRTDAKPQA